MWTLGWPCHTLNVFHVLILLYNTIPMHWCVIILNKKMLLFARKYQTIRDHRLLSIKSFYLCAFMFHSILHKVPEQYQFMHPQIQSQIADLTSGKHCGQKRGIYYLNLFYFVYLLLMMAPIV